MVIEQKCYKCLVIVSKCSLVYVEIFLAHRIKKKIQKTAQKLLKTAQNHEILLKVYTVSYYYWTKMLWMFSYCKQVFCSVYVSVF